LASGVPAATARRAVRAAFGQFTVTAPASVPSWVAYRTANEREQVGLVDEPLVRLQVPLVAERERAPGSLEGRRVRAERRLG
jgi:hypothetical protein